MIQANREFIRGIRSMAPGWQTWVMGLMVLNMLVPLVFYNRMEAQWVLAAFMAGGMTGLILVNLQGFTRLLGLMHIFWIPLLIWLAMRLGQIPSDTIYGVWVRVLIAVNGLSVIIDVVDVVRYLRGERQSLSPPLQ